MAESEFERLAQALANPRRWHELTDDECDAAAAALRRLEAENERLRADAGRLDHLERLLQKSRDRGFNWDTWNYISRPGCATIREQIDSAMGTQPAKPLGAPAAGSERGAGE